LPIRKSRGRGFFVIILLFAVVGAGAYLWFAEGAFPVTARAFSAAGDSVEPTVSLKDFQSYQQEIAASLQSVTQEVAAQKAGLKNLSDQIAALSARLEALQSAATPAPPPQSAAPAAPPSAPARKRTSAPKRTGPISVGGAPLAAKPPDGQ